MYASSVGKLLEGSSVTGCRVSKYHVNRVNSETFPTNPPLLFVVWMRPKRFKTFYYETTPVESKTFWIFVQCGRAFSFSYKAHGDNPFHSREVEELKSQEFLGFAVIAELNFHHLFGAYTSNMMLSSCKYLCSVCV